MVGSASHVILLYDGVCGLCNRAVQFILRRDRRDAFRFASLQSVLAVNLLSKHSLTPEGLDTMYVVLNPYEATERLLSRSDAVLEVMRRLGGIWRLFSTAGSLFPKVLRNFAYRLVVRNRYRIFGKYDACPLPTPEQRGKFLDQ